MQFGCNLKWLGLAWGVLTKAVENPDGKGPMGAIRTKEQLDEVGRPVLEI